MEDKRKILIVSANGQGSRLADIAYLLGKVAYTTVVSTLDDSNVDISGRAINSIICDELAEPIDMSVPEPKNKPHGPQRNSKKGKARKW